MPIETKEIINMFTGDEEKQRIIQQERQGNILNTLHQVLSPFLLRRVKLDVDLKIPPKKEVLVYCPMTSEQHEFYKATVSKTIATLVGEDTDVINIKKKDLVKMCKFLSFVVKRCY